MPSKRSFGTKNKLPSGRYRARYTGPDGARHSAPHTFETQEAAEAWLASEWKLIEWGHWTSPADRADQERLELEAEAEAKANVHTLRATYERYLEWRARPLSSSTLTDYEKDWRLRIEPYWGAGRDIATITNDEVWAWRKGSLGKEMRRDNAALALFQSLLKRAVEWGWIDRNPAAGVSIPRKRKPLSKRHVFTLDQVRQYLEAAEPHHVAMLATVALAGLRSGEVRALRRKDIDLEDQRLQVDRAIDFGRDDEGSWKATLKAPKTEAGERSVPFGGELKAILREHFRLHPALPDALAFPGPTGGPCTAREIDRRHERTLANMGLRTPEAERQRMRRRGERPPTEDTIRLHDLRASYAAWLFTQGYTLPDVMQLLGWSDSKMALETYSRVFPDGVKDVGARQDDALGTLSVKVS